MLLTVAAAAVGTLLHADEHPAEMPASVDHVEAIDAPVLVRLIGVTLREHPEALSAEAELEREHANAAAASRPLFNPEIELEIESADATEKRLRVSQTLDIAGRRAARTRVAEENVESAALRLAQVRRDLAVELLGALARYWTAAELSDLAAQRVTLLERVADVVGQRARVGDVMQTDVNLAELALVQARIERASAAADLAAAEQTLGAIVPASVAGNRPELPTNLPAVDVSRERLVEAVARAPEVALDRQGVAVAEAQMALRERERRPTPSVSLIGGEEDNETLVGIGFSMPLNVRNRFRSEVDAARAEQRRAQRTVDNVTMRALAAAEAATARYRLVRGAWEAWHETGAASLSQQTELLERLWRAGELSLTDYLVQINQTLDTQHSAAELRFRLWDAWFACLAATARTGEWLGLSIETPEAIGRQPNGDRR